MHRRHILAYSAAVITLAGLARSAGLVEVRLVSTAFLQSLGDHLCRTFLRWRPTWTDRPCRLDKVMGLNLLLLGRKPPSDERGEPG